jgi:hypothetical protein
MNRWLPQDATDVALIVIAGVSAIMLLRLLWTGQ